MNIDLCDLLKTHVEQLESPKRLWKYPRVATMGIPAHYQSLFISDSISLSPLSLRGRKISSFCIGKIRYSEGTKNVSSKPVARNAYNQVARIVEI